MSVQLLREGLVSPKTKLSDILNIIHLGIMENLKLDWLFSSQEMWMKDFCALITGNKQTLHTVGQEKRKNACIQQSEFP